MSNDLEIKRQSVGDAMQQYQSSVDDFDRESARILGINRTDLRCLEILVSEPAAEVTPRVVADRLSLTTGSVTTMLDRLEQAGYVTRTRHPGDRRKVLIHATPRAQQRAWSLIGPKLQDDAADVVAHFSLDELDVVERFITRASDVERRHVERLREAPPL